MLKVTMLQTPSITLDGVPVSLPFKRADALLYYMMVQRSATRQELIALLWENRDEATGLKNLRNTPVCPEKGAGRGFSALASEVADPDQPGLGCGLRL